MRILAVSDQPSEALWGPSVSERLAGIDLILSCGDLDPYYLSYLVTFTTAPVLYVHGNHDSRYRNTPPEGCVCVDDKLFVWRGLRILGLGGSIRYNLESPFQYTQAQMRRRVRKLWLPLHMRGGFDILLTHAPAYGLGDGDDLAHTGFEAFVELMDRWTPLFFVHGHVHMTYNYRQKRLNSYNHTQIINAFERYIFDTNTGDIKP